MNAHSDYEPKTLADAKEAILGTTQGGSAADVYATLPGSYRDYIRYLFDDSRTKIVCDVIKAMISSY